MQPQPNLAFDTLGYAKELESAGFTQQQAEVQARTFLAIVQEQLVSKRDLKELEAKMTNGIKELETALKYRIQQSEDKTTSHIKELEAKTETKIELIRRDIKELEAKTETKIEAMEVNLTSQMEFLRRDLKIWIGSMLVVVVVALSSLVGFLSHLAAHAH